MCIWRAASPYCNVATVTITAAAATATATSTITTAAAANTTTTTTTTAAATTTATTTTITTITSTTTVTIATVLRFDYINETFVTFADQGAASNGAVGVWKGVQVGKTAKPPCTDIDERLRCLQQELDRVAHSSNPGINSSVLHAAPQHYPTSTLRLELEAEIDRLLREQVRA